MPKKRSLDSKFKELVQANRDAIVAGLLDNRFIVPRDTERIISSIPVSHELLQALYDTKSLSVHRGLASNPSLTPEMAIMLAADQTLWPEILKNPTISSKELERMAKRITCPATAASFVQCAGSNPNITAKALQKAIDTSAGWSIEHVANGVVDAIKCSSDTKIINCAIGYIALLWSTRFDRTERILTVLLKRPEISTRHLTTISFVLKSRREDLRHSYIYLVKKLIKHPAADYAILLELLSAKDMLKQEVEQIFKYLNRTMRKDPRFENIKIMIDCITNTEKSDSDY